MKTKSKYILAISFNLFGIVLFGHDIPVHQAITGNAEASAYAHSTAYADFLNTISSDRSRAGYLGTTVSMVNGSGFEDDIDAKGDVGGIRSYNHFYDPLDTTYGKGLSDWPADKRILIGNNSFTWASISNGIGYNFYGGNFLFFSKIAPNLNTTNIWSWPNARGYEWLGLTATNQLERQANLDNMFRAVGQVMHLLEDASQPQHVRNEQHVDKFPQWRSPIEDYGNLNVLKLNYGDGSMLDWRGGGFTKLEDFWDRHLYDGSSAALDDAEADGGTQLGLAEWCNGNFLGDRHQYADYYTNGDIRHYPYPSRISGTITPHIDSIKIKNGRVLSHYYLGKSRDGISITHHSALTLWGMEHPNIWNAKSTTIRDDNVLSDYHNAFIPKAVKYSAGLLDYFFRGTMKVTVSLSDTSASNFTNIVQNTSGQDFHGGTFYVLQDSNTVRSILWQTNLADLLQNPDASFTNGTTLSIPCDGTPTNKLLLAYQGTIGFSNGAALDPVDSNICIAVGSPLEHTIMYTYQPSLASLGLTNGSTIVSNLASEDFYFTPTSGNYKVTINRAYFDDNGSIGCDTDGVGGISAPLATDCGWPHDPIISTVVPPEDVTIVGNHLQVNITATDNGCGVQIGWVDVSITWRAWPAP